MTHFHLGAEPVVDAVLKHCVTGCNPRGALHRRCRQLQRRAAAGL